MCKILQNKEKCVMKKCELFSVQIFGDPTDATAALDTSNRANNLQIIFS